MKLREKIRWNEPKFGEMELKYVDEVLQSGYVSEGPMTKELEERLAKIIGCKYVVMTTSGTMALYLAVKAYKEIKGGYSLVNYPVLTFLATRNALQSISHFGMDITDVEPERYTFIPSKQTLDEEADLHRFPRLHCPVNILGRSAVMPKKTHPKDFIICDNAGAFGSDVPIGDIGCYSLQGNKIISCGQGGFCATNNKTYAECMRQIKDFGRRDKEDIEGLSSNYLNYKFNDILAAVVLGQLHYLEEKKSMLKFQHNNYMWELYDYGKFIKFEKGEIPLWVEFFPKDKKRNELIEFLKKNDVECRVPWKPLIKKIHAPNAWFYYENCVWLPNGNTFTISKQMEVIKLIKEFYGK